MDEAVTKKYAHSGIIRLHHWCHIAPSFDDYWTDKMFVQMICELDHSETKRLA